MIKTDTNQQLELVFKNGILPTMLYINRQESGRNKIERPLHKHNTVCEIVLVYKGSGTYILNNKNTLCTKEISPFTIRATCTKFPPPPIRK